MKKYKNPTPSMLSYLFWSYGYIDALSKPIARKNRITGVVQFLRYNESFGYWAWNEVSDKYKSKFVS